jgi:hypothetical protein
MKGVVGVGLVGCSTIFSAQDFGSNRVIDFIIKIKDIISKSILIFNIYLYLADRHDVSRNNTATTQHRRDLRGKFVNKFKLSKIGY